MDAFRNLLQHSKIERRTGYALHILELIVDYNIGNSSIVEAIEHQLIYETIFDTTLGISRTIRAALKCNFFSELFYDSLFQQSLTLLPKESTNSTVELLREFEHKRDYIEEVIQKIPLLK